MCTALTYASGDFYFGRNLDLEYGYKEAVTVTPRNFSFHFRSAPALRTHYAIIGMATVVEDYPLYYEATNEKGLSLAGLNFPGNAVYYAFDEAKDNIAPFELIPWFLGQCENVTQAEEKLSRLNLWSTPFSEAFPLSPLHWILADSSRCLVLESLADGLKIHENPAGVLTNNPPFDFHMHNLANYMHVTARVPENRFGGNVELKPYSLGMGSIGLPGDLSSASRFVRAAFTRANSVTDGSEADNISQFFHILDSVAQTRGLTTVRPGEFEITRYSSCCNASRGIYYYTTYGNRQITALDMHSRDLNGEKIYSYPISDTQQIKFL